MGSNEHDLKIKRKIDKILQSNQNLMGFYSYISENANSTVYNYLLHINSFLEYRGNERLSELKTEDFAKYMKKIEINEKGELSTASYRITVYSALKKYGSFLVNSEVLTNNPMDSIARPKAVDSKKTIEKRENGYLTQEEILQLIKSVKRGVGTERGKKRQRDWKERDLAIIILLLVTGIKSADLIQIDIQDVDIENKVIYVDNKVLSYDLSDDTIEVLVSWIKKRDSLLNQQEENALFISNRRTRIDQTSVYRIVNKYAEVIIGKNITPEQLRATYGTQLYNATNDTQFVQEMMGLNSPLSMKKYMKKEHVQKKQASDIMASVLAGKNDETKVNKNSLSKEEEIAFKLNACLESLDTEECAVLELNWDLNISKILSEINIVNLSKVKLAELDNLSMGEFVACINNLNDKDILFVSGIEDAKEVNQLLLEEYLKFGYVTFLLGKQEVDKIIKVNLPDLRLVLVYQNIFCKDYDIAEYTKEEMFHPQRSAEEIKQRYIELKKINLYN